MVKKIILIIFFSLSFYLFYIGDKINILFYNVEREKEMVCIMFERQVFILENQSLVLNRYIDDIVLSEIKLKLYILKKDYDITNNEVYNFEETVKKITDELKMLCEDDDNLKDILSDFQIKIEGSQNRLSVAKRDYTTAVNDYNKFINSTFCFPYKLFFEVENIKNIYVRDVKKQEIDGFKISIRDGVDVFEQAYNSIFNSNK